MLLHTVALHFDFTFVTGLRFVAFCLFHVVPVDYGWFITRLDSFIVAFGYLHVAFTFGWLPRLHGSRLDFTGWFAFAFTHVAFYYGLVVGYVLHLQLRLVRFLHFDFVVVPGQLTRLFVGYVGCVVVCLHVYFFYVWFTVYVVVAFGCWLRLFGCLHFTLHTLFGWLVWFTGTLRLFVTVYGSRLRVWFTVCTHGLVYTRLHFCSFTFTLFILRLRILRVARCFAVVTFCYTPLRLVVYGYTRLFGWFVRLVALYTFRFTLIGCLIYVVDLRLLLLICSRLRYVYVAPRLVVWLITFVVTLYVTHVYVYVCLRLVGLIPFHVTLIVVVVYVPRLLLFGLRCPRCCLFARLDYVLLIVIYVILRLRLRYTFVYVVTFTLLRYTLGPHFTFTFACVCCLVVPRLRCCSFTRLFITHGYRLRLRLLRLLLVVYSGSLRLHVGCLRYLPVG